MARPGQFQVGDRGNPKGRPKGAKTKFRVDVMKILEEKKCNPFEILVDLAMNSKGKIVRLKAATELCSYIAPKLKHIEHAGDKDQPLSIVLNMMSKSQQLAK